jgi:hypothetical protein
MAMSCSAARVLLAIVAVAALAACSTTNSHIGDEDAFMGESVKYDAAIQTINPAPVYPAETSQAGDNGEKGTRAVKRYRTDAVKEVQTVSTASGASGPR